MKTLQEKSEDIIATVVGVSLGLLFAFIFFKIFSKLLGN